MPGHRSFRAVDSRGPVNIRVLYEDNHLYVVEKPAELPTMGAAAGDPSLVEYGREDIRNRYQKPGNVFLGVVSRLDAHVSGVVVFARTSKAAARLSEQFRERSVQKTYVALVTGDFAEESGRLEDWLLRDDRRQVVVSEGTPGADFAALRFRAAARIAGMTMLSVSLETGRRHQIRTQLSAAGHPICGDRLYGSMRKFPLGIALHAMHLQISHPIGGRPMEFHSELPEYWPEWSRNQQGSEL